MPKPTNVTIHGKRDFVNVIKLRILETGEIILHYLGEPNVMSCPIKGRQRETLLQKRTNVRTETGFYTAGFDHGGGGPEPRNARNVSSRRKGRKQILP